MEKILSIIGCIVVLAAGIAVILAVLFRKSKAAEPCEADCCCEGEDCCCNEQEEVAEEAAEETDEEAEEVAADAE